MSHTGIQIPGHELEIYQSKKFLLRHLRMFSKVQHRRTKIIDMLNYER